MKTDQVSDVAKEHIGLSTDSRRNLAASIQLEGLKGLHIVAKDFGKFPNIASFSGQLKSIKNCLKFPNICQPIHPAQSKLSPGFHFSPLARPWVNKCKAKLWWSWPEPEVEVNPSLSWWVSRPLFVHFVDGGGPGCIDDVVGGLVNAEKFG